MHGIPVIAAEKVAKEYGYDQVIIVARKVGFYESVTTYGKNTANCDVAARIGEFLKHQVFKWPQTDPLHMGLIDAIVTLADDVETVARDSYARSAGTFQDDWKAEDPNGYAAWKAVKDRLDAIRGW